MQGSRRRSARRSHRTPAGSTSSSTKRAPTPRHSGVEGAALELQEQVGNRAVVSILRQTSTPGPGKATLKDLIDFDVPGLDAKTARRLRHLLANKQRQKALDLVVTTLAERGEIDRTLLHKATMHYRQSEPDNAWARTPGYETDTATGDRTARPTLVWVGPTAFSNPTELYSTVIHEYTHVAQYQRDGAKGTGGQRSLQWLVDRQEVEAYAAEIDRAKQSGLWWRRRDMRRVWRDLHDHWMKLGPKGKKLLRAVYTKAHRLARKAAGPRPRLPFRP